MRLRSLLSLNLLLVFIPIALAIHFYPPWHNDLALFICAGLAIIPLAGLMGRSTEALAAHFGPGAGGLLNATFGNAAELIIALFALSKGLTDVVKASITGSIIGNVLLVFGMAALGGGCRYRVQRFNRSGARVSATSLSLASIALLTPTVFHVTADLQRAREIPALEVHLSLAIAVVLFLTYCCVLFFSLVTHRQLFEGQEDEEEHELSHLWTRGKALLVLIISTVAVAVMSEFLVSSIETARKAIGLTEVFVGVIVVAVIGNAAEHSTAILAALKDKMDLSLSIAVGSSLQIALFVAPVLVFVSYPLGRPMDLEFSLPEITGVAVAVYILFQISGDGETNWLEGVQLLSLYLVLGILFFYLPPKPE
jgi:Ca2+:H+ antiporter